MFSGLASFEVVALAADHWFGSLEKSPGQFFIGFANFGLLLVVRTMIWIRAALVNGMVLSYPKAKG